MPFTQKFGHVQKEIRSFLKTLTFPLYFLDFETFMPAIPPFDGCWPYMGTSKNHLLNILT
ncbi:DUF2779 domain-containing protein [Leadbettera azotonutricia]|uniref:DUF2779 domain-containing protein n=1 Tax=Leadbettera azotonutricia TaxID=150829 RepID=UPI0011D23C60